MAEGSGYRQDAPDYSILGNAYDVALGSYDAEYLATCVRFAQSYGIYPTPHGHQQDTGLSGDNPCTLLQSLEQEHSNLFYHPEIDPRIFDEVYANPFTGNMPAGSIQSQQSEGDDDDTVSASCGEDIFEENQLSGAANCLGQQTSYPSPSTFNIATQGSTNNHGSPTPLSLDGQEQDLAGQTSSNGDIGTQGLAVLHNYDPFWVQNTGADPPSVYETHSKMKFEVLFYDGVIQNGDRLVVAVEYNVDGVVRQDEAILTHIGFSKTTLKSGHQKHYPDFALTLLRNPDYHHTILACKGTNTIIAAFHDLHISGPNIAFGTIAAHIDVWRGEMHLGTCEFVKQAYNAWKNDMDACMQTSWRRRRNVGEVMED